jgi:hypothetical protein
MIPIRRVAGDLREVRWANVFVEFVLLILGILIALAVNGWLEDRRDAQLEREYLGRLQQDLDQNLAILREYIGFEQKQVDDGVLAYRALRGVDEYDRETVATALSHLADRRTLRLVRSTYQDLIGTGSLGLIRDPVLRDKVVRLFEDSERMVAVVDRNNQVLVDEGFGLPLFQSGLVSPRLSQNNAVLNDGVRKL